MARSIPVIFAPIEAGTFNHRVTFLKGTFVKRVFYGQWQAIGDSNDPDFVGASNWFETVHGATNAPDSIL